MKKLIMMVLILSLAIMGSACEDFVDSGGTGKLRCEELLKYLNDNDAEGLKTMFCNITAELPDFDDQIQEAIQFFEGEIIEHDSLVGISGGGKSVRDGETTKLSISPHITGIVTTAGKTYEILFYDYLINTEYEDKVGISELLIESDDGKECVVGEYIR